MLRGMQMKPDDLGGFRLKLRIVRGHVTLEPVWPQSMLAPHSRDHHVTDAQVCRELARAPAIDEAVRAVQLVADRRPRVPAVEQQDEPRTARLVGTPRLTCGSLNEFRFFHFRQE